MHAGKLVFAQVMEFAPWHTFRRLVAKYRGDFNVRRFSRLDRFLCLAFAQLTYRESLRDIEACLRAQPAKLYHLGLRGNVSRRALADANEERDWRIYYEFAQALIRTARRLYAEEPIRVDISETVYALDSTTIDLCLALFPWAPFRATKAAVKPHTLLDLRGSIPTFVHISDGKLHDVNVLDLLAPEPGAFYVMDRSYLDFERLPSVNRALVHDLATGRYLAERAPVLIVGPCGTGKSHLAQALGHCAVRQGVDVVFTTCASLTQSLNAARATGAYDRRPAALARVPLLVIDDLGLKPLRPPADEDLHDLIAERYETAATVVTSNLDYSEWDQAFPANRLLASATLDRLRHNANCLVLDGQSYRSPKLGPSAPKSKLANTSKTTHS